MDAKEIKSSLKSAREAIKNKDFKTALQLCKTVLKSDRNNYAGLVLFGVALQDSDQKDQAPKAFRKAIEVSPKQILAWQGLASYYEKEGSETEKKELLPVYQQLLALESDEAKFLEICNKLALTSVKLEKVDECVAILMAHVKEGSAEKQRIVWKTVTSLLMQEKELSVEMSAVLETALSIIVKDSSADIVEEYHKKYLKLLYGSRKLNLLLDEARNMHSLFPESQFPLEWICKVYSEQIAQDVKVSDVLEDNIDQFYGKLEALNPDSSMVLLAKGAELFKKKNFIESCDALRGVIGALSQSCHAWILLCRCYLSTQCYIDAEHCVREALKVMSKQAADDGLRTLLLILLVRSLSFQDEEDKLKETVNTCTKILAHDPGNVGVVESLTRAHIMLENYEQADRCLQALQNAGSSAALLAALRLCRQDRQDEAVEVLDAAVQEDPNCAELWLELGKLHWQEERYSLSLTSFLKAAKLDPHSYSCYVYLGHYYSQGGKDLDKARRCYQKAFRLNPNCKEAGAGLSDIYRLQKNSEANIQLLTYVTQAVGCTEAKWAWLRLGLHHTEQGNHQEAVDSLLSAIRADPTDSHCWESLADAYYGRGAHTAALKSYQRVLELNPDAVYPAFQLGTIKQIIGLYEESIEEFRSLLINNPTYVPALKGLGETCLCLARSYFTRQLLGCCRDSCQNAVNPLCTALEERKDLSCLWKLLGDASTLVAQLPDKYSYLQFRAWATTAACDHEDDTKFVELEKANVFQQAVRCYCRALSLASGNALVWHDLAYVYHLQAGYIEEVETKTQLQEHALAAVKKCVMLNPKNWQHWNLLGAVAASPELGNLGLAQHAFIKAIQLENNAITWTNLGTLYLCLNEIKLAHEAFKVAQRTDPAYVESWIGQALIAESMNHEDAMDLFRHTTQLGIHPESCIGYSHWVCSTLKNTSDRTDPYYVYSIEKMHAIPVAGDSMTWYTGHINKNACAFNMLGLLLERQKLYRGAAGAFEAALKLLEADSDSTLSDMVHSNLGRVLVELQRYSEAIQQYQAVQKADFVTQCGLAMAYFKANQYEDSYASYETAMEWLAPTDGFKSHIFVAMAAMAYMCQGAEDSKTLLFKCIELQPPSVQGLFAFCSLGMLHTDLTLSELALKELAPHRDNPAHVGHIAVFKAYTHFLQGRSTEAVRALSSTVHRHPGQPSLWLALALLLLHLYSKRKPSGAARCAQVAMALGRSTMDVSKVMSLVSLSHLLASKAKDSLRSSQKAVHMFPDIPENWVVLIASFMPWCMHQRSSSDTAWLKRLISHVRRKLDASREMNKWLSNHERKVALLVEGFKRQ
ncbi:tetratricopeptide repeat protein 37 [Periplaneta americana]|uniref:tetratricopeptide repeat protein 37 n=1 Tax=Periplaneta americana TaxID=6978 RepID=UPI0037E94C04